MILLGVIYKALSIAAVTSIYVNPDRGKLCIVLDIWDHY
jgi:hypothetical protein